MGGAVIVDTTAFGQLLIAQPVIACALLGWLTGDVSAGLTIGMAHQLVWLRLVPLGGSIHLQGNFAAISGTGTAVLLLHHGAAGWYGPVLIGLLYGIFCGHLAGYLVPIHRNWNGWLVSLGGTNPSPAGITVRQAGGALVTAAGGGLLTLAAVIPAYQLFHAWSGLNSPRMESAGALAVAAFLGVGIITVTQMFWQRKQWYMIAVGAFCAALWWWI
jgi:hypothetical protein